MSHAPKRARAEQGGATLAPALSEAQKPHAEPPAEELRSLLLLKWGTKDAGCKYVLDMLSPKELSAFVESKFQLDWKDVRRSPAEQINIKAFKIREEAGPGGGALDAIAAFGHRWGLRGEEVDLLRRLNFKELRHVVGQYAGGGVGALKGLVQQANAPSTRPSNAIVATVPREPGGPTLGRPHRLELIDPFADALVLGDANLSFSRLLARHRRGLGHSGNVVATTFEQLAQLQERYVEIDDTIRELQDSGAEVWHGVDCTQIALDERFQGLEERFGAVYYNFPHAGAVRGFFDAHPFVHWRHENLMHLFFRALRAFMKRGGIVKVASNSNATGVRYTTIMEAAALNEFVHMETVPFQEWLLRKYNRSFGDKRDAKKRLEGESSYTSQKSEKDMVYMFSFRPSGVPPPRAPIKRPPACSDFFAATVACKCGFVCPLEMKDGQSSQHHFKSGGAHAEAEGRERKLIVAELYKRFLSELAGEH